MVYSLTGTLPLTVSLFMEQPKMVAPTTMVLFGHLIRSQEPLPSCIISTLLLTADVQRVSFSKIAFCTARRRLVGQQLAITRSILLALALFGRLLPTLAFLQSYMTSRSLTAFT